MSLKVSLGSSDELKIALTSFQTSLGFWSCLDCLPLACPCMAYFYATKLNLPLNFSLKIRNKTFKHILQRDLEC